MFLKFCPLRKCISFTSYFAAQPLNPQHFTLIFLLSASHLFILNDINIHTHTHTFYFLLSLGYSGFFVFSLSNSNGRVILINCLQQQQLTLWYCAHSFVRAAAVHSTLRFLIAVINLNSLLLFHSLSLSFSLYTLSLEKERKRVREEREQESSKVSKQWLFCSLFAVAHFELL